MDQSAREAARAKALRDNLKRRKSAPPGEKPKDAPRLPAKGEGSQD